MLNALIAEIDATLSNASSAQHSSILRRVTDLFLTSAEVYSDEHVAIFGDVIGHLLAKIDHASLIELSARLAPVGNAPANIVSSLSNNDDIAVAGPLLEASPMLTDATLTEIAKSKSQNHLAAIAGRAQLGKSVTDILIDRGNSEVARKVADNPDAQLSDFGFVKLINRTKSDKALGAAIENRTDLPTELQPFLKLTLT